MASEYGESTSATTDAANFECNICFELAEDPIVTLCGHLFCWPCLYKWLHVHAHFSECPVCKALVEEDKLVPIYGCGKIPSDPRSPSVPGVNIPDRPTGQRPATTPAPDPNRLLRFANPWLMEGGAPVGGFRIGNYMFSVAIGGLDGTTLLNFQVHEFLDPLVYVLAAGFPNGFHGGHAHGHPPHAYQRQMLQGLQADVYLKALFILVGAIVVATLVLF